MSINVTKPRLFGVICYFAIWVLIASFQIEVGIDEALRPFGVCRIFADAIIVFCPYFLLKKRWREWAFVWWILFAFWLFTQTLYARTYHDLMPASSYFLVENLDGILIDSIAGSIRAKDVVLLLLMPALWMIYRRQRDKWALPDVSAVKKCVVSAMAVVALLGFMTLEAAKYYREEKGRTTHSFFGRFTEPVTVGMNYVITNGIFTYGIYALCNNLGESNDLSPDERKSIGDFLASHPRSDYNGATAKGKNLIFIVVESLNSWVVDYKVMGREVCPTLNSLCRSDSSLVALSMVSQVGDGRSSDGHFIYNVGLLPLRSGSVAVKYGSMDSQFPSLAKSLKGYSSLAVHCDAPAFWNNTDAFQSYGFERTLNNYDLLQQEESDADNQKANDKRMFATAIQALKHQPQPFYAQLITITMHMPYGECGVPATWISSDKHLPLETKNYLEKVHYFDRALGDFLDSLRNLGLYGNSVIAIASDHSEYSRDRIKNPTSNSAKIDDSLCMLVVANSPIAKRVTTAVGQIDVFPTLLDIMGTDSQWRGMGYSMLNSSPIDFAGAKDGASYGGDKSSEQSQRKSWDMSEKMVKYFIPAE